MDAVVIIRDKILATTVENSEYIEPNIVSVNRNVNRNNIGIEIYVVIHDLKIVYSIEFYSFGVNSTMRSIQCTTYILSFFLLLSCNDDLVIPPYGDRGNVNFMVTSDHFVKNFYSAETNPSYLLIRSYSCFDSLFGTAFTWDTDYSKLITSDKMEDGFVLSIIYQGNDIHNFNIKKINLTDSIIEVYYTSGVLSRDASWECNCHVTALIDNCEFCSIHLIENENILPDAFIQELP
jgi:hypothetical protein